MRPVFVAWLIHHGWPAWICPDYATMVGFATLLGAILILRQAERDGAKVHVQARALILAYVGAMVGGYLFEWIRAIPVAIMTRSIDPIAFAGRAAYGGLLFGALAPYLYFRLRRREPAIDFLDRATIGMGIEFACVRFGCFLEGCDYGRPTASSLGVRFPAGSAAADAHAAAGWVPAGASSLPVHATELYESCVGIIATLLALCVLRTGKRNGAAFATWLVTYAIGRFLLELVRGDVERGRYATLSTAQWVSIGILVAVFAFVIRHNNNKNKLRRPMAMGVAATTLLVIFVIASERKAHAQDPLPALPQQQTTVVPAPEPAAKPAEQPKPPAAPEPKEKPEEDEQKKKIVTIKVAVTSSLTIARPDVPSGWAAEIDAMYRLRLSRGARGARLDIGLEGRRYENAEAIHTSLGVPIEFVLEASRHFEVLFTFVPHHTWFDFKSIYFTNTNAYGLRYGIGAQIPLGTVILGVTPLSFTTTSSTTVGVISQWEPRIWGGVAF